MAFGYRAQLTIIPKLQWRVRSRARQVRSLINIGCYRLHLNRSTRLSRSAARASGPHVFFVWCKRLLMSDASKTLPLFCLVPPCLSPDMRLLPAVVFVLLLCSSGRGTGLYLLHEAPCNDTSGGSTFSAKLFSD